MKSFKERARTWLAVQVLGALVMVHAGLLFLFEDASQQEQRMALAVLFFSLGVTGLVVSLLARRWLGSGTVAWSSAVKFFGGLALLAFAPADQRALAMMAAMVLLVAGLTHLNGVRKLRREEQRFRPFLLSGAVNLVVSAFVLMGDLPSSPFSLCAVVAVATFGTGLVLFHYGRLLRRMLQAGNSLMEQIRDTQPLAVPGQKAST
jgi:uncharacterized membrane protein HdeD (DUF308 family)